MNRIEKQVDASQYLELLPLLDRQYLDRIFKDFLSEWQLKAPNIEANRIFIEFSILSINENVKMGLDNYPWLKMSWERVFLKSSYRLSNSIFVSKAEEKAIRDLILIGNERLHPFFIKLNSEIKISLYSRRRIPLLDFNSEGSMMHSNRKQGFLYPLYNRDVKVYR